MNLHGHIVATQSPGSTSGASLRQGPVYVSGQSTALEKRTATCVHPRDTIVLH